MDIDSATAVCNVGEHALPELWQRRAHLSHDEMASIYSIVRSALTTYHPLELQALGEDKEELISQFIFLKVFRLEALHADTTTFPLHSAPSNRHAVCAYFRRYLIDCLRSAGHQRNVPIDDALHEIERQAALPANAIEAALLLHGLDEAGVRESARAFIDGLDEADRLVLAGSLGWLSDCQGGLSQVAARYRIASYHYRAAKLGVTLKKHAQTADFARTAIGRWITQTLGIDIAPDNRAAILAVLGILSAQSREPE